MTSQTPSSSDLTGPNDQATSTTVSYTKRAAAGDEVAFELLFERHYQRVLRMTALRVGQLLDHCYDQIEDAVQFAFSDTFLRIREDSVSGIHTDQAFRRYVTRAAANHFLGMKRAANAQRRGSGKVRQCSETLFAILGTKEPGPTTILSARELETSLEAAILGLPDAYRKALELHCYAGMGYEEIAVSGELVSRSGRVVTTADGVRLIVHRARNMLNAVVDTA